MKQPTAKEVDTLARWIYDYGDTMTSVYPWRDTQPKMKERFRLVAGALLTEPPPVLVKYLKGK